MKQIKEKYGQAVTKQIRKIEKTADAIGRYRSHMRFNLQMKHTGITPKSIKIKAQQSSKEARLVIHKAEKALLNIRIAETIKKKKMLEENCVKQVKDIETRLDENEIMVVEKNLMKKEESAFIKSREAQKKKYMKLKGDAETKKRDDGREIRNQTGRRKTETPRTNRRLEIDTKNWRASIHNDWRSNNDERIDHEVKNSKRDVKPDHEVELDYKKDKKDNQETKHQQNAVKLWAT